MGFAAGGLPVGIEPSGAVYVFRLGSQGKLELASLISPSPERGDISGFRFAPETQLRSAV